MSDDNPEEVKQVPFSDSGKYFDEVRLIFDDQQELFVPQSFLMMSSPVFEAMFQNNFKEKQAMEVNLTGKKYADFLECLMCIHPAVLKEIDKTNVLRVAPISEEYQVASIVKRCKSFMNTWLVRELEAAQGRHYIEDRVVPARHCFSILSTAILLNYEELVDLSARVIAKFGHRIYYGAYEPDTITRKEALKSTKLLNGVDVTVQDIIQECRDIFSNLSPELRIKILSQRLALYRDNDMKQ